MKSVRSTMFLLALSALAFAMLAPVHSATSYSYDVFARTDKASYIPGDSGTLFITVKNTGGGTFTVHNITINYPWMAFVVDHWDGNVTSNNINQPVATPGGTWNAQYSFTVPTDGRAYYQNLAGKSGISMVIGTDIASGANAGFFTASTPITIALPTYQPLNLTTAALPVISIVLIAAAVVMLLLVYMGIQKLSKK